MVPRASISARLPSIDSSCTWPPGPKVHVSRSSRRWASSSGSDTGTAQAAPAGRSRISSAFAAATRSTVPSSSRCTGPTLTITPTSGSAIRASSAICPAPLIAISSTSASVPLPASRIVSGTPISVLKFSRLAWVTAYGASSAAKMSLVDVLPVEPVIPATRQPSSRRHAVASRWSASRGSSATITTAEAQAESPTAPSTAASASSR